MLRVGWIVYEGARSLVDDRTAADAYRALEVPITLITGDGSPLAARHIVARLGATLAGRARVERIAGAGHMGPLTHGKAFGELLTAHLTAAQR